jgi:hypothetical protein
VAKRWLDKDVENENGYCLKGIEDNLRSFYVKRLVVMELVHAIGFSRGVDQRDSAVVMSIIGYQ